MVYGWGWIRAFGWVVVAFLLASPRDAAACSCFGDSSLLAPAGAEHPVGAPLVFSSGCGGNLDAWSASVDGTPAMLMSAGFFDQVHEVGIDPPPPQGAEIVLALDCADAFDEPMCADLDGTIERARFTVGSPDTSAPPPVAEVSLAQEPGRFDVGCDGPFLDLALRATIDLGQGEPGTWVQAEFTRDGASIELASQGAAQGGVIDFSHYVDRDEVAGSEICVAATVLDASGNAAEKTQDCALVGDDGCGCNVRQPEHGAGLVLFGLVLLVARSHRTLTPSRSSSSDPS